MADDAGPFAISSDSSPPWALARLPVGRHGLPREFVEENQRNRLMAAALEAFATGGYGPTSIAAVIRLAGVSRSTFYAHFPDKETCFLATYDSVVAWLTGQATDAADDVDGWAHRTVAVVDSLLGLLDADVRLARLCAVEVFVAGPVARRRHEDLIDRLAAGLRLGRGVGSSGVEASPILEPLLLGGAVSLIARAISGDEQGGRLLDLGPELSEALLAPYLGPTAAREFLADRNKHSK